MDAKFGDLNYYHIRLILTKSAVGQVHIKFGKQTLNTPWYTENIACRAELGRYPLSIDIKDSIFSYWQRLLHKTDNPLLNEAFCYARRHSQFLDVLRVNVSKNRRKFQKCGHGQKIDFAHTLPV